MAVNVEVKASHAVDEAAKCLLKAVSAAQPMMLRAAAARAVPVRWWTARCSEGVCGACARELQPSQHVSSAAASLIHRYHRAQRLLDMM